MVKRISPVVLKELMESSRAHAVLDVRDPMEFHEKQIFMTTNAPRGDIEFLAARLVPVKATHVVCMDEGGSRAEHVAALLEECGYTDVSVLEGGLGAWEAQAYPTVSGTNVPSKDFGERIHVENEVPEITARELYGLIESDSPPRIFDTRTEVEFERFCVPTGRSLPGGELILHAWDLDLDKETPLIINCAGRTRSIIGTQALHRLGVTHARALKNGGMGIMLEGLQLDEGKPSEIPAPSEQSRAHGEVLGAQVAEEEGIPFVSAQELQALQAESESRTLYVLDVRLAPEFSDGHIPGAISIPGGQAAQRTDEVIAVRAGKVVTYCDKNARGVMAAYWLRQMGLDVSVLRGGLTAWQAAGRNALEAQRGGFGREPGGSGGDSPPGKSARANPRLFGGRSERQEAEVRRGSGRGFEFFLRAWPSGGVRMGLQGPAGRGGARAGGEQKSAGDVCLRGRAKIRPERACSPKTRLPQSRLSRRRQGGLAGSGVSSRNRTRGAG